MSDYEAGSSRAGAVQPSVKARCMSTENSPIHGEAQGHDDRWRELFPMPLCPEVPREAGLSVSARRRRAAVRSRVDSVNSIIRTLNEMYSPSRDGDFSHGFVRTRAQEACQHELFRAVANTKPLSKVLSMREAVQELLRTDLSYSGEVATTVRPYDRGLLSIPSCGNQAVVLSDVLDDVGCETIRDPHRCMLLDEEGIGAMMEENKPIQTYMDPLLRDDIGLYCNFVHDLFEAGMIDFTNRPQGLVTPFFVAKKSGKLRLILDCRETNRMFRKPPVLAAGTGASWSQIRIPDGEQLFVAQSDIKDYFYSLQLPVDLRALFSMPPIPGALLRHWKVSAELGGSLNTDEWVHPMLRVVPMGWSWAMWLSQRVHQHQSQLGAGVSCDRILVDGKPAPSLSNGEVLPLPYADNLNVCGINAEAVQRAKDKAVARLRQVGLTVHEEMDANNTSQSLGYMIDGAVGQVTPIPERLHRVQLAFKWLSRRPRVTGRAVQRLLGHAVHFMMLRRELLSIPHHLYAFVQQANGRCRLWCSAAVEARWIGELLPLCATDLRKQTSALLTASDASLSGIAVCTRLADEQSVKTIGSYRERWRFKGRNPVNRPRQNALGVLDPFSDIASVKPVGHVIDDPFELNNQFPEVPKSLLENSDWSLRFSQRMVYKEHITLLEGRGIVATLRHKFRSIRHFHQHHVHLADNLGMVLAVDKGRSSAPQMLRVCRRIACLLICTGSSLTCRWIPSELNIADEGSRYWEHLRTGKTSSSKQTSEHWPKKKTGASGLEQQTVPAKSVAGKQQRREGRQATEVQGDSEPDSSFSGSVFSGDERSFRGGGLGLQDSHGSFQGICQAGADLSPRSKELGQCIERLCQRDVRRWGRHRGSHKNPCSSGGQRPRLHPKGEPPTLPQVLARMEQVGPRGHKASNTLGAGGRNCEFHASKTTDQRRASGVADVRRLPQTGRGNQPPSERSGGAYGAASSVLPKPQSLRKGRQLEDGAFRRNNSPGRKGNTMDGLAAPQTPGEPQGTKVVSNRVSAAQRRLAKGSRRLAVVEQTLCALSVEALRAFARQNDQGQEPRGHQEAWQMVERLFGSALRGSSAFEPGVSEVAQASSDKGFSCSSTPTTVGPKFFQPEKTKDLKKWVLEIFSGTAHLSKAMAQQGFRCAAWDIDYGPGCDVLQVEVLRNLLRFISSHDVVLIWFGMPCQSWTRARRWDGGPPPLRDDSELLWGRTGLSATDVEKVRLGNVLLCWTVAMASLCDKLSIAYVIENPGSSRCWLTAPMQFLLRTASLDFVDYCQYGVPWRKNTGLLHAGISNLAGTLRLCKVLNGRCSANHKRHIILSGKDSHGIYWTHRAQPYPPLLCRHLALHVASTL